MPAARAGTTVHHTVTLRIHHMNQLVVSLFGRFKVELDGRAIELGDAQKAHELLCFLLINRKRSHPRETLASLLWDHCTTAQSKAYLRKALWQLQQSLAELGDASSMLLAEPEWIQINPEFELRLDVDVFEEVHRATKGRNGWELDEGTMEGVHHAVALYCGDLLENWYVDWCLYERERLQQIYLILLDKSMDYFELHHQYELGIDYGQRILQIDRARENTHQRLMRLCYLNGDRTGALRQYQRCAAALHEELDAEPAARTLQLYEQIRRDIGTVISTDRPEPVGIDLGPDTAAANLTQRITRLRELHNVLAAVETQIGQQLDAVELGLQRL
jgi:DNA-binding SARP family transcriptional activator